MENNHVQVLVECPYSHQTIDIAPLLYIIDHVFFGLDNVPELLSTMIEDFASKSFDMMEQDPEEFGTHIFYLKMLRRSFTEIKQRQIKNNLPCQNHPTTTAIPPQ